MKRINIKESVKNNVTGIENFNTQVTETIGKVIDCSERSNTCTINYINNENKPEIKTNVIIRIADPEHIGWYPKENDYVLVKIDGFQPVVIGDATHLTNRNKLREKTKFDNNIFASLAEAIGGFII